MTFPNALVRSRSGRQFQRAHRGLAGCWSDHGLAAPRPARLRSSRPVQRALASATARHRCCARPRTCRHDNTTSEDAHSTATTTATTNRRRAALPIRLEAQPEASVAAAEKQHRHRNTPAPAWKHNTSTSRENNSAIRFRYCLQPTAGSSSRGDRSGNWAAPALNTRHLHQHLHLHQQGELPCHSRNPHPLTAIAAVWSRWTVFRCPGLRSTPVQTCEILHSNYLYFKSDSS